MHDGLTCIFLEKSRLTFRRKYLRNLKEHIIKRTNKGKKKKYSLEKSISILPNRPIVIENNRLIREPQYFITQMN